MTDPSGVIIPSESLHRAIRGIAAGEAARLHPVGGDMQPFVPGGRVVLTVAALPAYRVGQMVLAESDRGLVLHRIVAVEGASLTLMADAGVSRWERCTTGDVVGAVVEMCDVVTGRRLRLSRARLWRRLLPLRRLLLRLSRKSSR